MFLAWLLTAHAADLDAAWYLAYTGRPEAAATAAAATLRDDPDDIDAHRLYVWARASGLREGPVLEQQYRLWAESGGGPSAELTLAWLLSWRNREPGAWCEELRELTSPLPVDPESRYWAQRVQLEVTPICGGDPLALITDLLELGDTVAAARPFALELALTQGLVDSVLQEEIATTLAEQPWALLSTMGLWGGAQGPRLEETQEAVIAVARAQADSGVPHLTWAAIQVLGTIGDMEAVGRVSEQLAALDPDARRAKPNSTGEVSWLNRPLPLATLYELDVVYEAANTADPETAIKRLKKAGVALGVDGLGRQAWQLELSVAYARLGKDKKSFRHLREAWAAAPENADVANQFAYTAALRSTALDTALLAIDDALARPIRWDPRGDHLASDYGAWLQSRSAERGAWLDTRGWVLHAMGRNKEAALSLEQSLLMAGGDASVQHLHLGVVYAALGKESLALDHLGRGLATGRGEEPALTLQARTLAESLFAATHWAPDGLDGWLAALAPDGSAAPAPRGPIQVHGGPDEGALFPDLAFFSEGDPTFLSSLEGWRVIDVWATWCGPCLEAMPHIEELAAGWADRGVTVLALSVDEDPATQAAWLEDHATQGLVQGWIGLAGLDELGLDGIPAVFVIDGEGVVRATLRGWGGPQDARLDDILEDLVGDPPVGSPESEAR